MDLFTIFSKFQPFIFLSPFYLSCILSIFVFIFACQVINSSALPNQLFKPWVEFSYFSDSIFFYLGFYLVILFYPPRVLLVLVIVVVFVPRSLFHSSTVAHLGKYNSARAFRGFSLCLLHFHVSSLGSICFLLWCFPSAHIRVCHTTGLNKYGLND